MKILAMVDNACFKIDNWYGLSIADNLTQAVQKKSGCEVYLIIRVLVNISKLAEDRWICALSEFSMIICKENTRRVITTPN